MHVIKFDQFNQLAYVIYLIALINLSTIPNYKSCSVSNPNFINILNDSLPHQTFAPDQQDLRSGSKDISKL